MTDPFTLYEKLWRHAEELGATVLYDGMIPDVAGEFHPNPYGRIEPCPRICIGRPYYEDVRNPTRERNAGGRDKLPPPDLLRETVTLAHECGHFLSWKERTPREEWDAYASALAAWDQARSSVSRGGSRDEHNERLRAAAQTTLSKEQLARIVAEEQRAWNFGRELLEGLGFEHLELYAERERRGLHFYRYRLGMEGLWADEIVEDVEPTGRLMRT